MQNSISAVGSPGKWVRCFTLRQCVQSLVLLPSIMQTLKVHAPYNRS